MWRRCRRERTGIQVDVGAQAHQQHVSSGFVSGAEFFMMTIITIVFTMI